MVHEWSLAESIVAYVKNTGRTKVSRLVVEVGALQGIDVEVLEFSLRELAGLEGLEIDELKIVERGVVLKCNACGYEWSPDLGSLDPAAREAIHFLPEASLAFMKCPRCGSRDFTIIAGRGVSILEIS
ncbi:MAG: hydrogenase nickel incorporation protein HypA [Desulfurococcaceae archaeon]